MSGRDPHSVLRGVVPSALCLVVSGSCASLPGRREGEGGISRNETLYLTPGQSSRIIPILRALKHRLTVSGSGLWEAPLAVDAELTREQRADCKRYASALGEPPRGAGQSSGPRGGWGALGGPGCGGGLGRGGGMNPGAGPGPGGQGPGGETEPPPPHADESAIRSERLERQAREVEAFIAVLQSGLDRIASASATVGS